MKPSDRRLLWGYGPAVVIGTGFLLMALLVPTVAPDQNVAASTGGSGGSGSQLAPGQTGVAASNTTGALNNAAGASSTHGAGSGSAANGSSTSSQTGGATQTIGSGRPQSQTAGGQVTGCKGPQVPGDPYSPPCVSFSGSNSGSTSRGVTSNQIVVSYRVTTDNVASVDAAIQQLAGKYNKAAFSDTEADIQRTVSDLVTYFNEHFQFYGRKIVLKTFNGQGSLETELEDGGQAQANADALTVADTIKAFADVTALTQPYSQALSSDGVVNIGSPYMSLQYYQQNAPYAYSIFPNCTDLAQEAAAVVVNQMLPQKVTWAGTGVADGQPRRYAVLAPDNPVYQSCVSQDIKDLDMAGHPPVANLSYNLDFSQLSQEAAAIEQQIVNDHITTVLCGCDPITLIYLTGDLANANYEPEFFNIGAAYTDDDLLAQLMDQSDWAHAAGVTNNGTIPPYGESLGYFAAKSVDPTHAPAHIVDAIYEVLYLLAIGIQGAGPDLTPLTFERGMFSYPGGDGEYGPWSFNESGSGTWTPQHQFRYEWYDPNAISATDGEQGTWVIVNKWYSASDVPPGPMPVFPNGPQ